MRAGSDLIRAEGEEVFGICRALGAGHVGSLGSGPDEAAGKALGIGGALGVCARAYGGGSGPAGVAIH